MVSKISTKNNFHILLLERNHKLISSIKFLMIKFQYTNLEKTFILSWETKYPRVLWSLGY